MPTRKKKKPVLYELVSKSHRSRGWRSQRPGATPPPTTTTPPPAAPPSTPPRPPRESAPPPHSEGHTPVWRVENGRLLFALGWSHLTIAGVVLLIVLAGVFQMGKNSAGVGPPGETAEEVLGENPPRPGDGGRSPAEDPEGPLAGGSSERNRQPSPADPPRPGGGTGQAEPPPPEPQPAAFSFEDDQYYVIVQHFPRKYRQRAINAARFLADNQVGTVVYDNRQEWIVVATRPFATKSAAGSLVQRIKQLGQEYFRRTGLYRFEGAYVRDPR